MTALLGLCLAALGLREGLLPAEAVGRWLPAFARPAASSSAPLAERARGGDPAAQQAAAESQAAGDAVAGFPLLAELASPVKRVDIEPPAANRLPLSAPQTPHNSDDDDSASASDSPERLLPKHVELFDWQAAVLEPPPTLPTVWSRPHLLLSRLDQLPLTRDILAWRSEVQLAIQELLAASSLRSAQAAAAIERLELLFAQAAALEASLPPTIERYRMHATADTLRRNALIWKATQRASLAAREEEPIEPDMQTMLRVLDGVKAQLDQERNARSWREFLELARLWQIARSGSTAHARDRLETATRVLMRLEQTEFNERQQRVLDRPAFVALVQEIQRWAYQPVHYESLLFELQRYEALGREQEAEKILTSVDALARSPREADRYLAEAIRDEYRGAGMRLAVSESLLNRFLPEPTSISEPVREQIRGANVRGHSQVLTGLQLRLIPDQSRLRLDLEARGLVDSSTTARRGPAAFRSHGRSLFVARKPLMHDGRRLFVWRSEVASRTENRLADFETDYDSLPLINLFARSMALQQHDEEAPLARREVDAKLQQQLRERFDDQIHERLLELEKQWNEKVLAPLNELQLAPSVLSMRTSETRLICHYRLAAEHQLTSPHTRPWAPSASLLSMQLHQSTVNNLLNRLQLGGRRLPLREIYEELADTFRLDHAVIPDDLPDDVTILFAEREPIRVDFHDDTVSLTLHVTELRGGDRSFRNFTVRAHYEPETEQLEARLLRRSYVELIGDRLSFGDQIALRGVFSKAFAKHRPISLLDERLLAHPAFDTLRLTQFQVEYGWLAVAVGRQGDPIVGQETEELAEKRGDTVR